MKDQTHKKVIVMKIKYFVFTILALSSMFASAQSDAVKENKSYMEKAIAYHNKKMEEKKAMGANEQEMAFFKTTSAIGIGASFVFKKCSGFENEKNDFKDCKDVTRELLERLTNGIHEEDPSKFE